METIRGNIQGEGTPIQVYEITSTESIHFYSNYRNRTYPVTSRPSIRSRRSSPSRMPVGNRGIDTDQIFVQPVPVTRNN